MQEKNTSKSIVRPGPPDRAGPCPCIGWFANWWAVNLRWACDNRGAGRACPTPTRIVAEPDFRRSTCDFRLVLRRYPYLVWSSTFISCPGSTWSEMRNMRRMVS